MEVSLLIALQAEPGKRPGLARRHKRGSLYPTVSSMDRPLDLKPAMTSRRHDSHEAASARLHCINEPAPEAMGLARLQSKTAAPVLFLLLTGSQVMLGHDGRAAKAARPDLDAC